MPQCQIKSKAHPIHPMGDGMERGGEAISHAMAMVSGTTIVTIASLPDASFPGHRQDAAIFTTCLIISENKPAPDPCWLLTEARPALGTFGIQHALTLLPIPHLAMHFPCYKPLPPKGKTLSHLHQMCSVDGKRCVHCSLGPGESPNLKGMCPELVGVCAEGQGGSLPQDPNWP